MYVENITDVQGKRKQYFQIVQSFIEEVKEHEKLETTYSLEKELTVIKIIIPLNIDRW